MFFFYQFLLTILIFFAPFIIVFRILKNKEHKTRTIEKFSVISKKRSGGKIIWFHGSSVGEIMSVIPLIKYYEKNKFISKILITSSTLSSSKIINKFRLRKTIHQFYPVDHFFFTNKFLNYWKPNLAIFIDSEIWPTMFVNIKRKKIPLILLNARITKKTFNRWMLFRNFAEKIFSKVTIAFPQNNETKILLKKLKINKIKLIGNLKFIENNHYKDEEIEKKLYLQFIKYKIWVAASTHSIEEIFSVKAHIELKKKYKKIITIIIPRHVDRVDKIISKIKKLKLNVAVHSSKIKNLDNIDIYIVDTFGDSQKFYKIGATVFLGKSLSLTPKGGQNPLEAARYGAKILHGPNIDNFKDVYKLLNNLKVSKQINTIQDLVSSVTFQKNKSKGMMIKKIGNKILKNTIKELDKFINDEFKKT